MGYRETYASLSDDEILKVASDHASLEPDAQAFLAVELSRRNLTETEVLAYRQRVASFKREDGWDRHERIARTVNGFGTFLYGKRDFGDERFVRHNEVVCGAFHSRVAGQKHAGEEGC